MRRLQHCNVATSALSMMVMVLAPFTLLAQGNPPPLDFTRPASADTSVAGIPAAVLNAALAAYNSAGTRTSGDFSSNDSLSGGLGVYRGQALIGGWIRGGIVIVNGDLRLAATARIDGKVIVIGGHLYVDPGATFADTVSYSQMASVSRSGDGTLKIQKVGRSLLDYGSVAYVTESFALGARFSVGPYNRVEELPLRLSGDVTWRMDDNRDVKLSVMGLARTATSPTVKRSAFGWSGELLGHVKAPFDITGGARIGKLIVPMNDQPFYRESSGISAVLFKRDYRDWYSSRFLEFFGDWKPNTAMTVGGTVRFSRDVSAQAVDAFSLFRSAEDWRSNPLIDDGKFVTVSVHGTVDTRNDLLMPTSGWYLRGEVRQVMSQSLTPVSLPTSIRDELPNSDYRSTELNFDARYYRPLGPTSGIHLRLAGGGAIGGDPLTLQNRRAMGGTEQLGGYPFRALNCDRRRRPDPATPALCDREMIAQVEYRKRLSIDLSSRVGGYTLGFQQPDLVLLADAGSAWLSGDGAGKVPSGRIQTLGEWRSSIGIGLDGGALGIYLHKALVDPEPYRVTLSLRLRRF